MNDLARILVKGGDGGNGKVSFRHESGAPKGGPDGGDGGQGGDAIVVADENIDNLIQFNFQKKFEAPHGEHGMNKKMYGKDAKDITIRVPVGTVVWEIPDSMSEVDLRDRDNFDELLKVRVLMVDLDTNGKNYVLAYGGKGGRGNDHFKSSTNQTPMKAEPGQPGEKKWLLLEHKVVADVGIIGFPNVGKSSVLKALTRANPKIAGYPFTTLEPNLGVVVTGDKPVVLVDVPGVVEEAYEGKGIGPWFLRHLERTKLLVHILAPDEHADLNDAEAIAAGLATSYQVVREELNKYGNGLPEKKETVAINKNELVDEKLRDKVANKFEKITGKKPIWISAAMGKLEDLVKEVTQA